MISKELLSEVLREPIYAEPYIKCDELFWVRFYLPNVDDGIEQEVSINIYELAYKCKEWALGKDFVLYSGSTHRIKGYRCDIYTKDGDVDEDFVGDTEPEAIFKACEWIMEQIK